MTKIIGPEFLDPIKSNKNPDFGKISQKVLFQNLAIKQLLSYESLLEIEFIGDKLCITVGVHSF